MMKESEEGEDNPQKPLQELFDRRCQERETTWRCGPLSFFPIPQKNILHKLYSVFHQMWQTKFNYGGSILSLSQFLLLPQLPQKNEACFKGGKNRLKNNHFYLDINP